MASYTFVDLSLCRFIKHFVALIMRVEQDNLFDLPLCPFCTAKLAGLGTVIQTAHGPDR
jgi:hypothetical protein